MHRRRRARQTRRAGGRGAAGGRQAIDATRPPRQAWWRDLRHTRWLAGLLVVAGCIAYANAFTSPFVFDDTNTILENTSIRRLWPPSAALSAPRQSAVAGRPIVNLSFAVNYALGGTDPWSYHAFNLALHLANGLLLFGIVRRTLSGPRLAARFGDTAGPLAFACALVWIVHPLNTEVVDYVTERTESMMGFLYLLTLYAAIRGWILAAIASCALGMASKESMVTAPVMVALYDACFGSSDSETAGRRPRWLLYTGLASTWLILVALAASGPRSHSAGWSAGLSPWTYLTNQPVMISRYLKLAFWPRGLVLDYGRPHPVSFGEVWPHAAVAGCLIVATAISWRSHRELAFLGTWFLLTLAPTSSLVPIATEVGAERRMYLPLAALIVLVVTAVWSGTKLRLKSPGRDRRAGEASLLVLATASIALVALTRQRNAEYHSPTGIWQTVLDRYPHGRAHVNLGTALINDGRREEGMRQYRQALADAPEAHYALGQQLEAEGTHDEAASHLREYIRLQPEDIKVLNAFMLLGHGLAAQGRTDEAADAFRAVLARNPSNSDAKRNLGAVYTMKGLAFVQQDKVVDALVEFQRAAALVPNDPAVHHNLGNALASAGRLDEAVAEYQRALTLDPDRRDTRENLAEVAGAIEKR